MKKAIVFLLLSLCAICGSFAQDDEAKNRIVVNGRGDYCFETSFPELMSRGVNSEVWVRQFWFRSQQSALHGVY